MVNLPTLISSSDLRRDTCEQLSTCLPPAYLYHALGYVQFTTNLYLKIKIKSEKDCGEFLNLILLQQGELINCIDN